MEEDRRCCLEKDSDVMVDWAAWHASADYPLIRARLLAWNAYLFFWPRSETLIKQASKQKQQKAMRPDCELPGLIDVCGQWDRLSW